MTDQCMYKDCTSKRARETNSSFTFFIAKNAVGVKSVWMKHSKVKPWKEIWLLNKEFVICEKHFYKKDLRAGVRKILRAGSIPIAYKGVCLCTDKVQDPNCIRLMMSDTNLSQTMNLSKQLISYSESGIITPDIVIKTENMDIVKPICFPVRTYQRSKPKPLLTTPCIGIESIQLQNKWISKDTVQAYQNLFTNESIQCYFCLEKSENMKTLKNIEIVCPGFTKLFKEITSIQVC